MAEAVTESPQVAPDTVSSRKKTRMNPTRRKTAKAKAEAEAQKTQPEAIAAINSASSQPPARPTIPRTQTMTNASVQKQKPSLPPPLSRTKTEPLPKGRNPQILTRTITTPGFSSGERTNSLALKTPALVTGGLVGCVAGAAVLLGVGMWYDFAGAESAILAARAAKLCVDNLAEEVMTSLKAGTYSADEALDMLRRTTLAYASTIPEGAPFVERVFREIQTVRLQRGREIDKVVAETYAELEKAGRRGAESAEMQTIVVKQLMKLSSFAGRATQDIVTRNPKLRPYRDGMTKAVQGPEENKVPTVRVNMAVRQKQVVGS